MSSPLLLVDDDEVFRERLAQALRQRGQDVVTAADGDEAVRAAERGRLAAAVVDLRMPGMTGTELLPQLLRLQPNLRV
ncbi:MAG TPA: response regulator, partial [Polyangia bacterium]|nr:response regulator [Polyangia bacterium]